jgi:putative heme-binding domain-containing protein
LQSALRARLASTHPRTAAAALPIAVAWGSPLKAEVGAKVDALLRTLEDASRPDAARMDDVTALAGARRASPAVLPAIGRLLAGPGSPALKRHAIAALGATGDPQAAPLLLDLLTKLDASSQDAAVAALLTRREGALAVLAALEAKSLPLPVLGPIHANRLRTHPDRDLARQAVKILDALRTPATSKDALIAGLLPQVLKPGSAAAGKEVYLKSCANCHVFNDLGKPVGPVLTGMGAHGPELLLTNILDPNRAVDAGYEAWNVRTKDGAVYAGLLAQENDAQIVLKSAEGVREIPKASVDAVRKSALSLMPEGLEAIGPDALRDLLAFLTEGAGKYRVIPLDGAFTADTRRGLFASSEALGDTVKFAGFGMVQADGIPFHLVDPAKSALGGNVIILRGGGNREAAHAYPDRVEVKVGARVKALHLLGGVAGWGASRAYDGPTILTLKLLHEGGATEVVELQNGVHFVDYFAGGLEVPGSRRAPGLVREQQIRIITVPVSRPEPLLRIQMSSPGHGTTGVTAAITAELAP